MSKMSSLPEEEKLKRVRESSNHLSYVQEERNFYKKKIEECQKDLPKEVHLGQVICKENGDPVTQMHYSFDFAQQVQLPQSPDQVGEIFFLTGYKVALFGIAAEPLKKFVLFVIPEACDVGKGANTVISLLDYYLNNFTVGEDNILLHADNCVGQNKNNTVLQYCARRVMNTKKTIQLSFLPKGHTKFGPDMYFGIFKQNFRRSNVHSIKELIQCAVEASPKSNSMLACAVGDEKGNMFLDMYDWVSFFANFNATSVKNMTKQQHFFFEHSAPGKVTMKPTLNGTPEIATIFPDLDLVANSNSMTPTKLQPKRLTLQRKKYLATKIRPFVSEESKDVLCRVPKTCIVRKKRSNRVPKMTPKVRLRKNRSTPRSTPRTSRPAPRSPPRTSLCTPKTKTKTRPTSTRPTSTRSKIPKPHAKNK